MKSRIHITAGFWLVILLFAAVNGWDLVGVILLSSFVHEMGHYLLLKLMHAEIRGFQVNMFGIILDADTSRLSYGKEFLSVVCGPLANLLCAFLLGLSGRDCSVWIGCNLSLCIFNLLPLPQFDGERMLYLLISWFADPQKGERWRQWIGSGCSALVLSGLILFVWRTGGSFWLLPPALGLLSAAFRKKAEKRMFFVK